MWLRLDAATPRHPKTADLAIALEVSVPHATGLLACLWTWAVEFATDGDLSRYPVEYLENTVLHGTTGAVRAMGEAGFIDVDGGRMVLHDWGDYQGKLIDSQQRGKAANRERQARYRDRQRLQIADNGVVTALGDGEVTPLRNERNGTNGTNVTDDLPVVPLGDRFANPGIIDQPQVAKWQARYSKVDLAAEFEKMASFLSENPKRTYKSRIR